MPTSASGSKRPRISTRRARLARSRQRSRSSRASGRSFFPNREVAADQSLASGCSPSLRRKQRKAIGQRRKGCRSALRIRTERSLSMACTIDVSDPVRRRGRVSRGVPRNDDSFRQNCGHPCRTAHRRGLPAGPGRSRRPAAVLDMLRKANKKEDNGYWSGVRHVGAVCARSRALGHYRLGHHDQAIKELAQFTRVSALLDVMVLAIRAMAQFRSDQPEAARQSLADAHLGMAGCAVCPALARCKTRGMSGCRPIFCCAKQML